MFKKLNILPFQSQYIFSLLLFVVKNRDLLRSSCEAHNIITRYNSDIHLPTENLTIFQRGAYYSGIRIFNHLQPIIKDLLYDVKQFKLVLKRVLLKILSIVWGNTSIGNKVGILVIYYIVFYYFVLKMNT